MWENFKITDTDLEILTFSKLDHNLKNKIHKIQYDLCSMTFLMRYYRKDEILPPKKLMAEKKINNYR